MSADIGNTLIDVGLLLLAVIFVLVVIPVVLKRAAMRVARGSERDGRSRLERMRRSHLHYVRAVRGSTGWEHATDVCWCTHPELYLDHPGDDTP